MTDDFDYTGHPPVMPPRRYPFAPSAPTSHRSCEGEFTFSRRAANDDEKPYRHSRKLSVSFVLALVLSMVVGGSLCVWAFNLGAKVAQHMISLPSPVALGFSITCFAACCVAIGMAIWGDWE